jgi:N-acetylglucosaminyl-diphospho-decaprenol L-rhamnosyltransferase
VWVVDNASSDGSAELVKRAAPWATLVDVGENLGFGRAVDLVAARTDTPWLAPANADVALEPGALASLLAAGREPRTAVVAPQLILPNGDIQHSVYRFPTLPFTIAFNLALPLLTRRLAPRLSRWMADRMLLEGHWKGDRVQTVDWAIGAFLLIQRSAFDAVGGFDADQWMYGEDLDLGWRLAGAGYATRYEPGARVRHHGGAATSAAFGEEQLARIMVATYRVLVRLRGPVRAWATALVNWLGAVGRVMWFAPLSSRRKTGRDTVDLHRRWAAAHREGLKALRGRPLRSGRRYVPAGARRPTRR